MPLWLYLMAMATSSAPLLPKPALRAASSSSLHTPNPRSRRQRATPEQHDQHVDSKWRRQPRGPPRRGEGAKRRLRSLIQREEIDDALALVDSMASGGSGKCLPVVPCNILIKRLCSGGRVADAERVFAALGSSATVVTYNTMVNGYCRAGRIEDAHRLISGMPFPPDTFTFTFNPLIRALCVRGRVPDALAVFDDMLHRGCSPSVVTYSILLDATCKASGYRQAMVLLDEMRAKGCEPASRT